MRSLAWNGDHPVTQLFGVNPQIYAIFGLRGRNGIDIGCPAGTPLFTERGRRYKPVGNVADELIAKALSG